MWNLATELERRIRRQDVDPAASFLHVHRNEAVRLVDVARDPDGIVRSHYFHNCDIVGPAVLLAQDNVVFAGSSLGLDFLAMKADNRSLGRAYRPQDVRIESSRLIRVTLLVVDDRASSLTEIVERLGVTHEGGYVHSKVYDATTE